MFETKKCELYHTDHGGDDNKDSILVRKIPDAKFCSHQRGLNWVGFSGEVLDENITLCVSPFFILDISRSRGVVAVIDDLRHWIFCRFLINQNSIRRRWRHLSS